MLVIIATNTEIGLKIFPFLSSIYVNIYFRSIYLMPKNYKNAENNKFTWKEYLKHLHSR